MPAGATSLVLLALDPRPGARRDRRLALVAKAVRTIGIPTVALAPGSLLAALPGDVHGVALEPSPAEPLLTSLLQSALAVQLLSLGRRPRRHEPGPDPPRGARLP